MEGSIVKNTKARLVLVLAIGLISLFILFILSISLGTVDIPFYDAMSKTISVLLNGPTPGDPQSLIINARLARSIAVVGVGIGLSVAGVVMQALIRNPLVDPYITGVSSGAALGATLSVLAGITLISFGELTTPISAFIGAIIAFFLTMTLAKVAGGKTINYVLGGIIVGIAISSFTTIIIVSAGERVQNILFWLYGSFAYMSWNKALLIIIPVLILSAIILLYARELNVILLGDDHARQLGLNVKQFKNISVILVSVLTAVSVAFCGIIAFLGLIVPHISRMLVGGDHRLLLPTSMVLGAGVLLAADIFSRMVVRPQEIPIGAVISLIGAPLFIYLMIRKGKEYAG
jgi:iron complex transport system permease protein